MVIPFVCQSRAGVSWADPGIGAFLPAGHTDSSLRSHAIFTQVERHKVGFSVRGSDGETECGSFCRAGSYFDF